MRSERREVRSKPITAGRKTRRGQAIDLTRIMGAPSFSPYHDGLRSHQSPITNHLFPLRLVAVSLFLLSRLAWKRSQIVHQIPDVPIGFDFTKGGHAG